MFHIIGLKGRFFYIIQKKDLSYRRQLMIKVENSLEEKNIVYSLLWEDGGITCLV